MPGVATSPATEAVLTTAPPTLTDHLRQDVAQAEEHALHIHIDHLVEHGLVVVGGRSDLAFDAGVVEEAVDPAELLDRGPHIGLHLFGPGDIGGHRDGFAAVLADDAGGRFGTRGVAVHHHHLRTVAGERRSRRAADPIAAAGDQRNLAGKIHLTSLRWPRSLASARPGVS